MDIHNKENTNQSIAITILQIIKIINLIQDFGVYFVG